VWNFWLHSSDITAGKLLAWWHGKKSAVFSGFFTVGMFSLDKDMV